MASRRAAAVDRTPPDADVEARRPTAEPAAGRNRLDFYEALSDFRRMFPSMSDEVIEAVLRANDGMVEATIDQLLTMSADAVPPSSSSPKPSPPLPGIYREDRSDPHLATSLVHIDVPQQQQQPRANSPSSLTLAAEATRLPSTLLPLDAVDDDGGFSALMLQLSASDPSVIAPSLATAAAAADASSLRSVSTVATASITAAAAVTYAPVTSQQKLPPSQQFEDPFADLFAESNQLKTSSQSVLSSSDQQQQRATGSPMASQQRPHMAAESGRQLVIPQDTQSSAAASIVAPPTARVYDDSRGTAAAAGLPPPPPGSVAAAHRPPKPLGMSLSLPLSGSQQRAGGTATDLSPHSSSSSSSLTECGEHDGSMGRRDRERSGSLRLSPSSALTAAGDGRCLLTLPLGAAAFASSSIREPSGVAASALSGTTDRSSPQPRPARLSPSSGGGSVYCSSPGSGDLSPGEIVDLLERDDELPPSLPPPRLRGSSGKSINREQQQHRRPQQQQQSQQQLPASVGLAAAAASSGSAGGSDCAGSVAPKVLAAAARWSVPLIGPLPYHFLRLCDDDQLAPPPRPPKPHGKLSLLSHDEVAAAGGAKPALSSHAHHDGQQKMHASRSRSQRNALIIGALVADREGRDQRDSAAAAAMTSSVEPGARAKGRSSTLAAHQHSSSSSGGSSSSGAVGADEHSCRSEGSALPKQKQRRRLPGERLSTNEMKMRIAENERRIKETCDLEDLDEETVRYLEDERLALIMQNEEFLREVKRNEDFMRTLEFEQQLLEARLTVDKSRRLAAAQSRTAARTPDAFARRPSEMDHSTAAASLAALQQLPAAAAAAAAGSSSSSSPPAAAAAADSPSGLRAIGSSWSPAGLSASSSDPKLSAEASGSSNSSVHSSRSWASERIPMQLPASGSGGGSSGGASYAGGSSGGGGGGTQNNSGSTESSSVSGKAEASGGTEIAAADFRRQLQTMGTSSKKKFAVLAKNFFTRKVRRVHRPHNPAAAGLSRTPLGPSMLNLLDDCDDEDVELEEDNSANTCTNASSSSTSAPPTAATTHRTPYDC